MQLVLDTWPLLAPGRQAALADLGRVRGTRGQQAQEWGTQRDGKCPLTLLSP